MPPAGDRFVLWELSDAHVGSDLIKGDGRRSIAEAIEQSEGPNDFDWDVAVNLDDFSGNQGSPEDDAVRVRCYLHTSQIAPQGWYPPVWNAR
jgi:hypothetical protein